MQTHVGAMGSGSVDDLIQSIEEARAEPSSAGVGLPAYGRRVTTQEPRSIYLVYFDHTQPAGAGARCRSH